jgi:hypothetical protein
MYTLYHTLVRLSSVSKDMVRSDSLLGIP